MTVPAGARPLGQRSGCHRLHVGAPPDPPPCAGRGGAGRAAALDWLADERLANEDAIWITDSPGGRAAEPATLASAPAPRKDETASDRVGGRRGVPHARSRSLPLDGGCSSPSCHSHGPWSEVAPCRFRLEDTHPIRSERQPPTTASHWRSRWVGERGELLFRPGRVGRRQWGSPYRAARYPCAVCLMLARSLNLVAFEDAKTSATHGRPQRPPSLAPTGATTLSPMRTSPVEPRAATPPCRLGGERRTGRKEENWEGRGKLRGEREAVGGTRRNLWAWLWRPGARPLLLCPAHPSAPRRGSAGRRPRSPLLQHRPVSG